MKQYIITLLIVINTLNVMSQSYEFACFERYSSSNKTIADTPLSSREVVFMGNSITECWQSTHPEFFSNNGFVNRGISGQTTYQFLLRFRQDVINLHPKIVVINGGTNDIAENTGPYVEDYTFGNIVSMVELAIINNISVILTSVLPTSGFAWNPNLTDIPYKIKSLNKRLKNYAESNNIAFVDYYSALLADDGISLDLCYRPINDNVHPDSRGYTVMENLIIVEIKKIQERYRNKVTTKINKTLDDKN